MTSVCVGMVARSVKSSPPIEGVNQDRDRGGGQDNVEPLDPVAEALRQRKQEEAQHQDERDVRVAQRLRRDDREFAEQRRDAGDRRVEMEQRHPDRDGGGERGGKTDQPVDRSLLGFDVGFGLAQRLAGNRGTSQAGVDRANPTAQAAVPAACRSLPWLPSRALAGAVPMGR